jgi:hypothetical protein
VPHLADPGQAAAQIAVMEDPIDLYQQRGVAYRPRRGRSDPRGLVAQRATWQPCPFSTRQIGSTPNRSLWSSMKVITTAVAGRALARRTRSRQKDLIGAFQLPRGAGTDVDYWQPRAGGINPRSCWPNALLESAQNPA